MKLGDLLAEHFRLKATLIRLRFGIAVVLVWLIIALFTLFARVAFGIWILETLEAPKWIWAVWILSVTCGFLVEQIEKIEGKP